MVNPIDYHVDVANQINNSWYKNTVVGIYSEDTSLLSTVCISTQFKLKIKDKLKNYPLHYINGYLTAYLVFRCCVNKEEQITNSLIRRTWVCPDVKPTSDYMNYLQKCFSQHGKQNFFLLLKMKPKTHEQKSKAHSKVRKVFQGKKRPSYEFQMNDIGLFLKFFNRIGIRKLEG